MVPSLLAQSMSDICWTCPLCSQVVFYLIDLLQDKNKEVQRVADACLDIIMDTGEDRKDGGGGAAGAHMVETEKDHGRRQGGQARSKGYSMCGGREAWAPGGRATGEGRKRPG